MPLNYNSRSIHDLVTDLGVGFMDWADYDAAVRVGMPAHRPCVTDEKAFQAQYPDHPLNYYNRSRRIAAADAILRAARERPNSFPEDVLRSIHRVLFDCSAIVRDSLAQALFLAGDESSVAPLTELLRLENRLPGLDDTQRVEVARTVRRVVDKLLHAPTVRVKQLASAPGGDSYAEALRELFELDPQAVDAVAAGELPLITPEFDSGRPELTE